MRKLVKGIVLTCLLLPVAQAEELSVAMVTDMSGLSQNITETPPEALAILTELFVGDEVQVEKGGSLTLIYWNKYKELQIKGPSRLHILESSAESFSGHQPKVKKLLQQKSIRINPSKVTQSGLVMRSVKKKKPIRLLGLKDVKIANKKPVFSWVMDKPVDRVRFELIDEDGNILFVKVMKANHLTLPSSILLKEGIVYSWSVEGHMETGRVFADWGDFELADADLIANKERLKPGAHASFSERLLYAGWLQQQGFSDDAYVLWQGLANERPDSTILQRMLVK